MSVIVVGIEQREAPLHLLEQVAVTEAALPKALAALRDRSNLSEAVILSTCLRTEVYAVVERFHDGVDELQEFLAIMGDTTVEALSEYLTIRFDDDVADHVFTVASGLDSAVLGESEVLGQVRRAWEKAQRERASGPVLGALFRHAVETGKRVRSETAIARGITSLSHGAVALAAKHAPSGLAGSRVLVVGAGEMGDGVVQALAPHRPASVVVANRTAKRADTVIAGLPEGLAAAARAVPLTALGPELEVADVVFTSVSTVRPIVERSMVEAAVAGRATERPLLVVDLGVPRNVEPSSSELDGVTLLDMDALRAAVEGALSGRQGEVAHAREIVGDEVERYRAASRARGAAPVVSALRAQAEEARQAEFDRQRAKRSDLSDDQWEQVDIVTRAMVAKLLHQPTVTLKDAVGTPRGERLIESLRTLFDL
ncbi:MAG TPA: glutamyl-tRNA reductase [Acidimicrobiales bacterium]|nr:glutamyl-tRNA reductase [Acidimicrobiales bacterium]